MSAKIPEADTYLGDNNEIYCKRCRCSASVKLPVSVDTWVQMVAEFNAIHSKCLEQPYKDTSYSIDYVRDRLAKRQIIFRGQVVIDLLAEAERWKQEAQKANLFRDLLIKCYPKLYGEGSGELCDEINAALERWGTKK